jgi:hypothetical protein
MDVKTIGLLNQLSQKTKKIGQPYADLAKKAYMESEGNIPIGTAYLSKDKIRIVDLIKHASWLPNTVVFPANKEYTFKLPIKLDPHHLGIMVARFIYEDVKVTGPITWKKIAQTMGGFYALRSKDEGMKDILLLDFKGFIKVAPFTYRVQTNYRCDDFGVIYPVPTQKEDEN